MSNGETQRLELDDIQGIILHGYNHLPFVRYLFVGFTDADGARRWLEGTIDEVTTSTPRAPGAPRPPEAIHVAFTSDGLSALGFAEAEMNTFPRSFQLGMGDEDNRHTTRLLGDVGENAPETWDFGGPRRKPVHALLVIYADTEARRDARTEAQRRRMKEAGGVVEIHVEEGYRAPDGREHFGFLDGVSQPTIEGSGRRSSDGEAPIKAGEFILGYRNEYDEQPATPTLPSGLDPDGYLYADCTDSGRRDLGRNGTYLVFRKLSQDVPAFWRFASEGSKKADGAVDEAAATRLASKVLGRWPSGAPLVLSPDRDDASLADANAFNYLGADAKGLRCPVGAHVRRANPRDTLQPDAQESLREARRHRLMRRGRIYGPRFTDPAKATDDGVERGFQFLVVNADIHRQFEFVQQTWINSPKFGELYDDPDPLVGVHPHGGGRRFTVQEEPIRRCFGDMPSFVRTRGGGYFFLPSIRALRFIAQGGYSRAGHPTLGALLTSVT